MVKYWLKNRFIYTLIYSLLICIFVGFAFIIPYTNNITNKHNELSVYTSDIDFNVPSPSKAQISELEANSSIDSVFAYYYTKTDVKHSDKTQKNVNVLFSDTMSKLDITMYNSQRCISSSKEDFSNPVIIDYYYANAVGAKLGDKISVKIGTTFVDCNVSSIYQTNTFYSTGTILLEFSGTQKILIDSNNNVAYSGAYIKAIDVNVCETYLKENYIPKGRILDRSNFSTEEAYEAHYNNIMDGNYSNEITVMADDYLAKVQEYNFKNSENVFYFILAILIAILMFVGVNIIFGLRKSEKNYFKQIRAKDKIIKYYTINTVAESFISIVCILCLGLYAFFGTTLYITLSMISIINLSVVMAIIISSITMCFVNSKIARGNIEKWSKQKN